MTDITSFDPTPLIAREMGLAQANVGTVIQLLTEGNTVPFIARYRKEMTGSLDDIQIHGIEERRAYLVELDKRRQTILKSIADQGKLTDDLKARIEGCNTKAALEDLYLPYKPKRRTRATMARERGLQPLADRILAQPEDGDPEAEAQPFVDDEKGVADVDAALAGARDIVAETVAENADIRAHVRTRFSGGGMLVSIRDAKSTDETNKYKDYYDYSEPVANVPSHRFLAMRRGEREGVLKLSISVDDDKLINRILNDVGHSSRSPFGPALQMAVEDSFARLIAPSVENDVRVDLKLRSDTSAVTVFADNLRNLLLAPPLGGKNVVGVDPGLRTGCKCAALNQTGKFIDSMVFNLVQGDRAIEQAKRDLLSFVKKHDPSAIAVGNGTGGREAERFVRDVLGEAALSDTVVVQVSEAGASVYSASKIAQKEFPNLDVTVRGAISIARRLQDPLAELVKIEPKSIGVGQYQHDVYQALLLKKLEEVVESCVNHVGVDLNTASSPLLSQVAGIGPTLASNIVVYREENGSFRDRAQLLKVPKLGPRTFEQAAGFLRIRDCLNPLDSSGVHPERYDLVNRMARDMNIGLVDLVGSESLANRIEISRYLAEGVGEPTLRDIVDELKKPGRDPRDNFEPPAFRDDVSSVADLKTGMSLAGVVTNVTAFGAFVDVGVHRDGLVHISELADRFVKDPNEVVKVGQKIKVRVLEVDLERERISLSAKSANPPSGNTQSGGATKRSPDQRDRHRSNQPRQKAKFSFNPFADLLKK